MQIPEEIREFHRLFQSAGKELYVVGGSVRDHLLGNIPKDFDLVTNAMPDEIESILSGYRFDFTGKSFGVLRVYTENEPTGYEIATFRKDVTSGRKPVVQVGATIEEDCLRRDLTINAMFFNLDSNQVVDLVGGMDDLNNGIIRTPGDPRIILRDDKLRILRAIRFAAQLNAQLDEETWMAILNDGKLEGPDKDGNIVRLPQERITEEFIKGIKRAKSSAYYMQILQAGGLYPEVFPGIRIDPDGFSDYKKPETVLARLFVRHMDSPTIVNTMVQDLKIPGDIADGITMLWDAARASVTGKNLAEVAYSIAKKRAHINITDWELEEFSKWLIEKDQKDQRANARALSIYRLSVTGKSLIEEGMAPGEEMGIEQKRREAAIFSNLLQTCGRTIRD